jgi:hypothetical protein
MNFLKKNQIPKQFSEIGIKNKNTLKTTLLIVLFLMLLPNIVKSQENNNQAFWIHEDRVKPAMVKEYETVSKDLVAACKKHNIQDTNWITAVQDDNTYLYITAIDNLADLDKNGFATLSEKMGKDKMNALFNRYLNCYDEHGDYVVYLNKELSYMPGGITQIVEGKPYRTFYYNYITPSNTKNFEAELKKIKDLFVKKNSKMDYRVYKTGFGTMGTYYMIVIAGKNAEEIAKSGSDNFETMKDEFPPLLAELSNYTWKQNEKTGWMRNDLSYVPKK